jgi:hypothetical protein
MIRNLDKYCIGNDEGLKGRHKKNVRNKQDLQHGLFRGNEVNT